MYVAVTRAEDTLDVSYARTRERAMRAKGHDGCRASSADTANGIARYSASGFVVAAGFCGIVRAVAIGIGFAALVLFLVKQLAEFGASQSMVMPSASPRDCDACRLRWNQRASYFPCLPSIRCSAIARRCHRHHSAVAAADRDATISRLVPARLPWRR